MQVIAQDQSEAQLQSASCDEANIERQCARAEETGLPHACADLVTTAQALHWCAPPQSMDMSLAQVSMQLIVSKRALSSAPIPHPADAVRSNGRLRCSHGVPDRTHVRLEPLACNAPCTLQEFTLTVMNGAAAQV